IKMAVLTVPANEAQKVAEYAAQCGIEAIWNFSPVLLDLGEDVIVHNEYIGESLYKLIYSMNQRPRKGGKKMELLICVGNSCHQKGSEIVVKTFKNAIAKEKIEDVITLKGSFCLGQCEKDGITIQFDDKLYKTGHEKAENFFYKTILPMVKN
ncbi:MAG: hypothetical protein GY757_52715, partial [bacterium]|nr:hypothetical protein [bacterium]